MTIRKTIRNKEINKKNNYTILNKIYLFIKIFTYDFKIYILLITHMNKLINN
jgi:hypothetical protein